MRDERARERERKREKERVREQPDERLVVPAAYLLLELQRPRSRDGRFCSKVGQIGPKWDKSGTFSCQISVHLARPSQMY